MTHVFDIDTSPETPELLEIAEKTLRETKENREKGLAELRELLKKNPDLNFSEDDDFLTIILRCTHWYPESAIKLVKLSLFLPLLDNSNIKSLPVDRSILLSQCYLTALCYQSISKRGDLRYTLRVRFPFVLFQSLNQCD